MINTGRKRNSSTYVNIIDEISNTDDYGCRPSKVLTQTTNENKKSKLSIKELKNVDH